MKKSELLSILKVVDDDGKYIHEPKVVAKFHGMHPNAIRQARDPKKADPGRLDKLYAYSLAINYVESLNECAINGPRGGLLDSVGRIMEEGKRYSIILEECHE